MDPAWTPRFNGRAYCAWDTHELFSAVETLSHMRPLRGEKLMIISNGAALRRWRWTNCGYESSKLARSPQRRDL